MRVLMLGTYDLNYGYSRGRILWKGLKENRIAVDLCLRQGKWGYLAIAQRILRKGYDVILANGKPVLFMAWLLKLLHRKPIVFDTFISDYDSMVLDRKLVKPKSMKAASLWVSDWVATKLADLNFLDTQAHVDFFADEFGAERSRFRIVRVGAEDDVFRPGKKHVNRKVQVHFHGHFIPLHGIETIIRAAKLLEKENVAINIIGKGQTYDNCRAFAKELKVKNILWKPIVAAENLTARIADSDFCLGIFGTTGKALRVIPHKAYETIACARALITSDTPAHREILTDGKDALLVPPGDHVALAGAIRKLARDRRLRDKLAKNGHFLFIRNYTIKNIGRSLVVVLREACSSAGYSKPQKQ